MLAGTGARKFESSVLLKSIICFISRLNEVYGFSIKYRYSDILLKKKLNFSYSFLWNAVTVCFATIKLIVLAWFLWRRRHAVKVDPRCKSEAFSTELAREAVPIVLKSTHGSTYEILVLFAHAHSKSETCIGLK